PKLSLFSSFIENAASLCEDSEIEFDISNCGFFPPCVVNSENLRKIILRAIMDSKFAPIKHKSEKEDEDFILSKNNETSERFLQTAKCEKCKYKNFCPGLWKEYFNLYGDDEIMAVNDTEVQKSIHILQITKDCNQDCFYCCRDRSIRENSLNEIRSNIESLDNTEQIIITGGEPTLRKDLPQIINASKKKVHQVHLQTNGIKLSDVEYCKEIVQSGVDSVLVALPTFDNYVCENITRTKDILNKKIEGLKNLAKYIDLKTGVVFVPTRFNYKEFPEYVKNIAKISRDIYIQLSYTILYEGKDKKNQMVCYSELKEFVEKGAKNCKEKNMELRIDGIPLCFIPDITNLASDLKTRKYEFTEDFIDENRKIYDSDNYEGKEHIKTDDCKKCRFNNICKGIYTHYSNVFGTNEIKHL
ncbi:MAG: radical SAM protein, partial [Nanobdellota archaeon]